MMNSMQTRSLCVPEEAASSLLQKGFSHASDMQMKQRLDSLLARATGWPKGTTPLSARVVWLVPFIVLHNRANQTSFISRHRNEGMEMFEPFSVGLTGCFLEGENIEAAACRILGDTLGYAVNDVLRMRLDGFIWGKDGRAEETHIGVVFSALVDDLNSSMLEDEHIKGMWMRRRDVIRLHFSGAMDSWSHMYYRSQELGLGAGRPDMPSLHRPRLLLA